MRLNAKLRFSIATIALWLIIQGIPVSVSESLLKAEFQIGIEAEAKQSGGRSRGGTFKPTQRKTPTSTRSQPKPPQRTAPTSTRSQPKPPQRTAPRTSSSQAKPTQPKAPTASPSLAKPVTAPKPVNSSNNTGGRIRGGTFATPSPKPTSAPSVRTTPSPRSTTAPRPTPRSTPPVVRSNPQPRRQVVPVPVPVPVPIQGDRRPAEDIAPRTSPPSSSAAPTSTSTTSEPSKPSNPPPVRSSSSRSSATTGSVYVSRSQSQSNGQTFMLGLLVLGGILLIGYFIWSNRPRGNELENDIVTVSKLQVALLAPEGDLQRELTELTLNGDTDTSEGLLYLLQEGALALMRRSDRWCYVDSSSQTVKSREEAQQIFEQLSLEERSKFTAETLVNVNGAVQTKLAALSDELSEPGSYVVVTLLVGTADDNPLFQDIHTSEALRETLGRLGAISSEYLFVLELLWSPQEESTSLSSDELLASYSDMLPI